MAIVTITDPQLPQNKLALFELGFRSFFLLAAIFAVLFQLVWVLNYTDTLILSTYHGAGAVWYAHEMLFAYAVAAGFLLTAARNWMGQPTLSGRWLLGLILLWCLGRVLPFISFMPEILVACVDFLFLPLLAIALFVPIFRKKQWRNAVFPVLILLMALGNALVHLDVLNFPLGDSRLGMVIALYVVLIMIVIMAGRVVLFLLSEAPRGRWFIGGL